MTDLDLSALRDVVEARLSQLEREQGAALLDDTPYDAAAIRECHDELARLDAAEGEKARRARADAYGQADQKRTAARIELGGALEAYLTAVASAERSARSLADDLKLLEALSDNLRAKVQASGGRMPVALERSQTQQWHSAFLATLLSGIGGRSYYGSIKWTSVSPITDLSAHVEKYVAGAIRHLIEGE